MMFGGRRQGKSLYELMLIAHALNRNKKVFVYTTNVEAAYERIKVGFPAAKITKTKQGVLVKHEKS